MSIGPVLCSDRPDLLLETAESSACIFVNTMSFNLKRFFPDDEKQEETPQKIIREMPDLSTSQRGETGTSTRVTPAPGVVQPPVLESHSQLEEDAPMNSSAIPSTLQPQRRRPHERWLGDSSEDSDSSALGQHSEGYKSPKHVFVPLQFSSWIKKPVPVEVETPQTHLPGDIPMILRPPETCPEPLCVIHPDALRFFCETEHVEFCSLCDTGHHLDHNIICAPRSLCTSEKDTLNNVMAILRSEIKKYSLVRDICSNIISKRESHTQDVVNMVNDTFDSMLSLLQRPSVARANSQTENVTRTVEMTSSLTRSSLERDAAAIMEKITSVDAKLDISLTEMRSAAFENTELLTRQLYKVFTKVAWEHSCRK